ncbi:MAG: hypothetical protein RLZZ387_5048 [Chloroflexota bacterium]|jgi:uncharacterized protein involved in type VI secretion and phage assembly
MPNDQSQLYLKLAGADAPADLYDALELISVESSLHLPDVATLVLVDQKLRWVDHASLDPGGALVVEGKADKKSAKLFDGEIVEVELDLSDGMYRVVVRAFDRLHRLARGTKARTFLNMTDGDIIKKLAQEAGLSAKVGPTSQVHEYMLQHNETNLAFIQRRAAALGFLVYADGKTLHCEAAAGNDAPVELLPGEKLLEFRPCVTTIGQVTGVKVRGWDPKKKAEVVGAATSSQVAPKVGGKGKGAELAKTFASSAEHLVAGQVIRDQDAAKKLAQSVADHTVSRSCEAEGVCVGDPKLLAGEKVTVKNVGTRFSGEYFVTSATHSYRPDEGYRTQFIVSGLNPNTLLSVLLPEAERAPGTGLVTGVVTNNDDPDKQGRVKLKFPWLAADQESNWARIVSVGAGASRGLEVIPEVNDEVLVGFEHGDMNYPYVLGGLWNGKDTAPLPTDKVVKSSKVQQWVLRTRTGHELVFDEGEQANKGQIELKTAGGASVTLNDKDKALEIKTGKHTVKLDDQGNVVSLTSGGDLKIEAKGALSIKTSGKLELDGQGGMDLKSSAAMSLQSSANLDIKSNAAATIQANAKLDIKSNAAAAIQANAMLDIKSSAILNIQGTLVKIN